MTRPLCPSKTPSPNMLNTRTRDYQKAPQCLGAKRMARSLSHRFSRPSSKNGRGGGGNRELHLVWPRARLSPARARSVLAHPHPAARLLHFPGDNRGASPLPREPSSPQLLRAGPRATLLSLWDH